MRILICDDDERYVSEICGLIENREQFTKTDLQIETRHTSDFIENEPQSYDIAFVDINFSGGGGSGLLLAEKLKAINPDTVIIIITAFSDYLDEAMRIRVFRYISKPINRGRFYNALYDAIKEYLSNSKTIVIDMKDEVFKVKTKDILYIEISRRGTVIVTRDGELNTTRKLPEWLSIIDQPDCFIHSHNSIVVNLQNVINFNIKEVKLRKSETEIVTTYMSQRKFPEFKKSFMHYMGG